MPHNIEKSVFRRGEYVGFAAGVWNIRKSNSSFGRWCARHRDSLRAPTLFAFTLDELSRKLEAYASALNGRGTFAAHPVMTYEDGRTLQIKLEAAAATSGATLSALSGGGVMGLTPDDVKATPEWQAARLAYQRDHAALAAHNAEFLALHGARYAAERRAAREARTLDDLTLNT